jgi:hypothetical protein
MSAIEVIEQIKALPADEQAEVAKFVRELHMDTDAPQVRYMSAEKARVLSERIFEENAELFRKLAQ